MFTVTSAAAAAVYKVSIKSLGKVAITIKTKEKLELKRVQNIGRFDFFVKEYRQKS